MQRVSDAAAFRRDDHDWPSGAFGVSLALGLGSLAGSAALVASAGSLGRAVMLAVVFAFLCCVQAATYIDALLRWLRGGTVPARTYPVQIALVLATSATFFSGGPALGLCAVCGFTAGVFLPTAWASLQARVDRDLVGGDETRPARERERERAWEQARHQPAEEADDAPPSPWDLQDRRATSRRVPKVGATLREALAEDRERCLAWAAATAVLLVGVAGLGGSRALLLTIALTGLTALVWVSRRLFGGWLALRDFETAATEPRRSFVALLDDPNLRMTRPLLCIWSEEPLPAEGRLPRAEVVYRCDEKRDALISVRGGAVVHEAWLDSGPRARSRPRWVAADAGIALPLRRSFLGDWYVASAIDAERPGRARPLTMRAPDPTTENATGTIATVISEETPGSGHWFRLFAWRLAALAVAGPALTWIGRTG
ncbi:MAG: hypothetical protein JWQ15_128 [Marmoricola sp.]|nr:hypothetical protein [Marmoricola sp.]